MQHVRAPQDRIGVLISKGGSTSRKIEGHAEVRLGVDSESGSAAVDSVDDLILGMVAPDMVRVVSHGFAPENAMALLDDDMMMFELIDISRRTRNKNGIQRRKGHLIGESDRTREFTEELTRADIVVYDTTLSVIDQPEEVEVIRWAVEMILDGAPHDAVYSFLERKHNELTQDFSVRQNN